MTEYKIYGLKDPLDSKIKYVGVSKNIESRYKQHFYLDETEKSKWIQELKKQDLRPELIILEVIETDDRCVALNKEKEYIKMYKDQVYNITNSWVENKNDYIAVLITKDTKAMLKDYMDKFKMSSGIDISYHQAVKLLLNEHYKNIDNLFVEGNENN
jgi:predicted GIY-YIG superfamily endonuclease